MSKKNEKSFIQLAEEVRKNLEEFCKSYRRRSYTCDGCPYEVLPHNVSGSYKACTHIIEQRAGFTKQLEVLETVGKCHSFEGWIRYYYDAPETREVIKTKGAQTGGFNFIDNHDLLMVYRRFSHKVELIFRHNSELERFGCDFDDEDSIKCCKTLLAIERSVGFKGAI